MVLEKVRLSTGEEEEVESLIDIVRKINKTNDEIESQTASLC